MRKRRNLEELCCLDRRSLTAIALLASMLGFAGCATHAKQSASNASASPASTESSDLSPPPGPEAKIQISYSQPNDFLSTLSLNKYSGAVLLTTEPDGSKGTASVLRFDGGTPVWQINIAPGMFSDMPLWVSPKDYAVSEVKFGNVPPNFVQTVPDVGPPEPLEPGHFYIFSVTRKSGSVNYDAVKVNADGSLQAYEADPRAGTSFRLCCNVSSDFPETAAVPDTSSPDTSPPPDASGP